MMPKALQYVAQTGFVESLFWTLDGVIFTLILAAKIPKENKTKVNFVLTERNTNKSFELYLPLRFWTVPYALWLGSNNVFETDFIIKLL